MGKFNILHIVLDDGEYSDVDSGMVVNLTPAEKATFEATGVRPYYLVTLVDASIDVAKNDVAPRKWWQRQD